MWRGRKRWSTAIALASLLWPGLVLAQEGLSRRDGRGPVSVTVTLIEASATGTQVRVKVALDTHSVSLDEIKFEEAVTLDGPAGAAIAPTVEQMKGTGHHREAVLAFRPLPPGAREVRIVVKNVGGVGERLFSWDLPIGQ